MIKVSLALFVGLFGRDPPGGMILIGVFHLRAAIAAVICSR